ncbi:4Fe-4S binding protein [Eubacteriaceae bacterium ES3]|nr:4Fe-4S binding protein [Eubacteriaceae bacterium ES3]
MFDKNRLEGAAIDIEFCGKRLQSPFILSSGPLSYAAEGIIKAHQAGFGAVVTKTIRLEAAENPTNHMSRIGNTSLINSEKWADIDRLQWYEKEIPESVAAGATLIASVGHTPEEAKAIVRDAELAGAHMIELVSYTKDTMLPMLEYTKNHVDIPVICKLSGNWPDVVEIGSECLERGADGICAIDSIGPALKIDVTTGRPAMMTPGGYGYLTGEAIRPIALRINADIAKKHPELKNLYATGGIMKVDDAIEYLMAGAYGLGLCTVGILKGVETVEQMCYDLSKRLKSLGYDSVDKAHRVALEHMVSEEIMTPFTFSFNAYCENGKAHCVDCGKCVTVCCYDAREIDFPEMKFDEQKCRQCGLCVDVCPTGALTGKIG